MRRCVSTTYINLHVTFQQNHQHSNGQMKWKRIKNKNISYNFSHFFLFFCLESPVVSSCMVKRRAHHPLFLNVSLPPGKCGGVSSKPKFRVGDSERRTATWCIRYLGTAFPGLFGLSKLSNRWGRGIRPLMTKNHGNRSVGSASKNGLKYAGDFLNVGSFRRCSVEGRKLDWAHTLLSWCAAHRRLYVM